MHPGGSLELEQLMLCRFRHTGFLLFGWCIVRLFSEIRYFLRIFPVYDFPICSFYFVAVLWDVLLGFFAIVAESAKRIYLIGFWWFSFIISNAALAHIIALQCSLLQVNHTFRSRTYFYFFVVVVFFLWLILVFYSLSLSIFSRILDHNFYGFVFYSLFGQDGRLFVYMEFYRLFCQNFPPWAEFYLFYIFTRESSFISSIRFVCSFLFYDVLWRYGICFFQEDRCRGIHVSRCSGVVIASLNMPSMLFISSLLVVQPWHAYVIMGIIMHDLVKGGPI